MTLVQDTLYHFKQNFAEFTMTIDKFPQNLWNRDVKEGWEHMKPSTLAFHILSGFSFALEISEEINTKYPHENKTKEHSKEEIHLIAKDIEQLFMDTYEKYTDEECLSSKDEQGRTLISRLLIHIGHFRFHLGQLTQILRENDIEEPPYYPIRNE